jgi:small nuclear ribonucleoprotein (snRNP)-like protein
MTGRGWLRKLERDRVVIHTKDDRSIRGVLMHVHNDSLVLSDPRYLDEADTPLSGEVVVPRENVSWMQRLPSEAA